MNVEMTSIEHRSYKHYRLNWRNGYHTNIYLMDHAADASPRILVDSSTIIEYSPEMVDDLIEALLMIQQALKEKLQTEQPASISSGELELLRILDELDEPEENDE